MLKNNEWVAIIKAGLKKRNSNQNSHVICKQTLDMPKGTETEMTGFAQLGDVSIEREIWTFYRYWQGKLVYNKTEKNNDEILWANLYVTLIYTTNMIFLRWTLV